MRVTYTRSDGVLRLEPERDRDRETLYRLHQDGALSGMGRDPKSGTILHAQIKVVEKEPE